MVGDVWQRLFQGTDLGRGESHDGSFFINGRGELRVVPDFGEASRLILRASDPSVASLVDVDGSAVDKPEFAF